MVAGTDARVYPVIALLMGVLVSAVYLRSALTVLSSFVIDDFGITRSQFGWIFAVFAISGAVLSPVMGLMADGSMRRTVLAGFGFSIAGIVLASTSSTFVLLLVAAVVGGGSLATGNPSTNRVIAVRIPRSMRGLATGLKQSGAQVTLLFAGLVLPAIALAFGWRWALFSGVAAPVIGSIVATRILGPQSVVTPRADRRALTRAERRTVTWLAVTSCLMGAAMASVQAFLPLYAQEDIAMNASVAGLMAALFGLGGLVGRIGFTNIEHRLTSRVTLLASLPLGAAVATAIIAVSSPGTQWLLAIGAFGGGVVLLSWHAVAWLFVINTSHLESVGRASAIMQIGTFIGFGSGPLLTGYLVDSTQSYPLNWAVVVCVFLVVSAMAMRLTGYLTSQAAERAEAQTA